jgi:hypothetical protein
MRAFAEAWPDRAIVQQLGAQIPWKHNCLLLDRVKDKATRTFYIQSTIQHGWARSVLTHQIDTKLHARLGAAPTNFALTLTPRWSAYCATVQRSVSGCSLEPIAVSIVIGYTSSLFVDEVIRSTVDV